MQKGTTSTQSLSCRKHAKHSIRYICCFPGCNSIYLCEMCMSGESQHVNSHQHFIYAFQDFLSTQDDRFLQKAIPNLSNLIKELEKKASAYSLVSDQESQNIDKDFASLFKIFFSVSEHAKNYMKEHFKADSSKILNKINEIKKDFKELSIDKGKSDNFLFGLFNSKPGDSTKSLEDLIPKLISKNTPINKLRANIYMVMEQVEKSEKNQMKYKTDQQSQELFNQIKDNFENSCKEMYRQFKLMIEGGDIDEMKQSIFMKRNSLGPQKVTIDLTLPDAQSINNSFVSIEREMSELPTVELKRINFMPEITNPAVIEMIKRLGPLDLKADDSYFNNFPEQGPFEYQNQSVYKGHMKDNMKFGRGTLQFEDGAFYEGYWKDDVPFGFGRFIKANGDAYEGMCRNYKANGKGVLTCLNGYKYSGEWVEDVKHGIGEETSSTGIIIKGNFDNGVAHGKNIEVIFPKGLRYRGDMTKGAITGEGEILYADGEKYYGQLVNGKKHGRGLYRLLDGSRYEGSFYGDNFHGEGKFTWPDKISYIGQWVEGKQHGRGLQITEDGQEKLGEWANGTFVRWIT